MEKFFKFLLLSLILSVIFSSCSQEPKLKNFITVSGNKLMDGEKEFRFLSFNIPNLNFIEDEMEFTRVNTFNLPTSFEIRDAVKSVEQMGGTVIRTYTIPVKRENDSLDIPRYVTGPGEFNENSFLTMDTLLAIANHEGMRLIVPLLNNWPWMGGRPQYAAFRGKDENEFWTDPQLIEDFKQTVSFVLNRKNTVTGEYYKDDKAIMCWETGNELYSTPEWTNEIVGFIKSIDTNHLVMDGYFAIDDKPVQKESIENPLIDILSSHHYELDPKQIIDDVKANLELIEGKKPYIIGEFGFLGTPAIEHICDYVIDNDISGALLWSLRFHRDKGGFYWHSEPLGGGIFKAFHYPGSESGIEYNEPALMKLFREKAYEIRKMKEPLLEKPEAPKLLPVQSVSAISWQGSAGATAYDVERKDEDGGDWQIVGFDISDADKFYTPLFCDDSVKVGKEYYYRVIAKNSAGESEPSNEVGPVKVEYLTYIHDMRNLTGTYYYSGKFRIATEDDRLFKEIKSRVEAVEGCEMIYRVPGKITGVKINSFSRTDTTAFKVLLSSDNINYLEEAADSRDYYYNTPDYDYRHPIQTKIDRLTEDYSFIKLSFSDTAQLARVEINYIPAEKN